MQTSLPSAADRQVVEQVFQAMQAGPQGENLMLSLFSENAVLIESFSGQTRTHTGLPAIRAAFVQMTSQESPPDVELKLETVEADAGKVRATWSCTSSVFPAPMRGVDFFTIRNGKIDRLEIQLVGMPTPSQ